LRQVKTLTHTADQLTTDGIISSWWNDSQIVNNTDIQMICMCVKLNTVYE